MRRFSYCLILLTFFSCKKIKYETGENHLPLASTSGRGIFACYVGDKTYVARRQDEISYNIETGYLFLENKNEFFRFQLFVYEGIFGEGNYTFDNTGEEWITADFETFYGLKEGGVNQLEITRLDLGKRIVSGNFSFDLISEDGEEKQVRDGRFDLKINYVN